jgi:hypothetical protein
MKKVLLLLTLALALPLAAFADSSIDFTNSGGTLAGTSSLALSGSTLVAVNGLGNLGLVTGTNLGGMSFTTGALNGGGSLQTGGTFAAGGSFTITTNGTGGLPNTTLFSGTFSGATWTLVTLANGTHNYTLTGVVAGSWYTGAWVNGVTVQLTINTGKGYFDGSTRISSGDTNIVTPEPGTLTLFGTGMLGLAGLIRRKLNIG